MIELGVADPIRWWARLTPDKAVIVDRVAHRRLSYAELNDDADRWAVLLAARNVGAGDRVAVLSGNRPEVVALFYGCARVGAALVPLNWRLSAVELGRVLDDAKVSLIVGEDRFAMVRHELAAPAPWLDLDSEVPAALTTAVEPTIYIEIADAVEAPAMILYTSGSTGQPKGAADMLTTKLD